jgi:drug/metabolite transporter (DMT)-like permease
MSAYLGQFAALATSLSWSVTSIFFTLSGRRVGSVIVNRTRLLFAVVFAGLMHWATEGQVFPFDAEPYRFGWLALSGLIGFVIGDSCLFQAFVMIGPRLSMLMMALAPVLSTVVAWVFLGETLTPQELLGIAVTIGGVALVVSERPNSPADEAQAKSGSRPAHQYGVGVLFGLGAAIGQAGGFVTSKLGVSGDFPALSGSLIRLVTAAVAIWLLPLLSSQVRASFEALRRQPLALLTIMGGATTGPFLGVWLSLIAIQNAPLGVASTLTSLAPIILLPVGHFLFKERIGIRAIGGTIAAVLGTAILFL